MREHSGYHSQLFFYCNGKQTQTIAYGLSDRFNYTLHLLNKESLMSLYMSLKCWGILFLSLVQFTMAATFTVSQDGTGQFTSIQQAVDMATAGDEVVILDADIYEEEVIIDNTKDGLTLRSQNPRSVEKPTIRFTDRENAHPTTYAEAQDTAMITYHYNGALKLLGVLNVTINGICIDGGTPTVFAYPAVWGGVDPQFHGNSAIALNKCGATVIRDCDIRNAYYGIHVYDHNEGGVNAVAGPNDLLPENIVPYSGYARSGNHLIEYNRIHNNTWGIYFESLWDLGSTIRYNLIYQNHHANHKTAAAVAALPGGLNQCGGAFLFKDALYTPVSIHNNTFWKNLLIFAGLERVGAQHLVFNNIYAEPVHYWTEDASFFNPTIAFDQMLVNRTFNCVYSCQAEPPITVLHEIIDSVRDAATGTWVRYDTLVPTITRVRIMNGMEMVKRTDMKVSVTVPLSNRDTIVKYVIPDVIVPGNHITAGNTIKPFPESSNVRWAEISFLSTDPDNPDFLTPDWANPLVEHYITDRGWKSSGVKDPDGTSADIGAIPMGGGRPVDIITLRMTKPIMIYGNDAAAAFEITPCVGEISNPTVTMMRLITGLEKNGRENRTDISIIPAENCISLTIPQNISTGRNEMTISNPGFTDIELGFIEFIVEGIGSDGLVSTSTTGFLPIRDLDYLLKVNIFDKNGSAVINEITAGDTAILHIEALGSTGEYFENIIDPTSIACQSQYVLFTPEGDTVDEIPGGITRTADIAVVFRKVPHSGKEFIGVAGSWINGDRIIPFLGSSDGITINPGPADSVDIQNPTVKTAVGKFKPEDVFARVFDRFGNAVRSGITAQCLSSRPDICEVIAPEDTTNGEGIVKFSVQSNEQIQPNDTFDISVGLPDIGAADTVTFYYDANAVAPIILEIRKKREYRYELFDLRGKLILRQTVFSHNPVTNWTFHSNRHSKGMLLMKITDTSNGKIVRMRTLNLKR